MASTFTTNARIDMTGLVSGFRGGMPIKIFRHSGGWSVECGNGMLMDAGTDQFHALEPLAAWFSCTLNVAGQNGLTKSPT
jgi:hypothetical protein